MAEQNATLIVTNDEKDIIVQALNELAAKHTRHSKNLGYDDVQKIYANMATKTEQLRIKVQNQK